VLGIGPNGADGEAEEIADSGSQIAEQEAAAEPAAEESS
jgi:hypothetical protein